MSELPTDGHLEGLGELFVAGLEARQAGNIDRAVELLRLILRKEPRLAEPRLELAHIHLEAGRLEEAELEAREGVRLLEAGGQWVDSLPEPQMKALAYGLLAEVLKRHADTDAVIFGDPERFKAILAESRALYARASALDPQNEHAAHADFFLNLGEE
jgi:tetratricopeptide (TPR) repeat protein